MTEAYPKVVHGWEVHNADDEVYRCAVGDRESWPIDANGKPIPDYKMRFTASDILWSDDLDPDGQSRPEMYIFDLDIRAILTEMMTEQEGVAPRHFAFEYEGMQADPV